MIKKRDLQLGDIVTIRLKWRYVVCKTPKGVRLLSEYGGWVPFDEYTENLSFLRDRDWDIIRIFRPNEKFLRTNSNESCNLDRPYSFVEALEHSIDITERAPKKQFINISFYV